MTTSDPKQDVFSVGYALIDQCGYPFPTTVALTERAVKVNALVSIFGQMVYATDSDAKIDADFARVKPPDFEIGPVAIERVIVTDEAGQETS